MEFGLVCLAGVQEGEWPDTPGEDPLLLAHERAAVAACLADPTALDTAARSLRRDRRWFQHACAAARDRLVLSWARFDAATGAACLPAASLLEFASRREGREVDYAALESLPWVERIPLHRKSLPEAAPSLGLDEIDTMHLLGLDPAVGRRYVLGLGECARRGLGLDRLRNRAGRFTSVDGMLAGRAAAMLQQRYAAATFSPTQLATYATCPFRFFLRQVLRLEPLERQDRREVSDLVIGRLVHRILEVFYRDLAATESGLEAFSDAELAARLQRVQSEVLDEVENRGQTGARLLWEIRKQRLGEDLRQFLRAERQRAGDGWRPAEFEWRFGPGTESVPAFGSAPGPRVRLRGIVDRVDRHPQHGGVRVVDYKSGRLLPTAHAPQAVQLAVYLHAATGGDPVRLEASEAHFASVTRRGGFALQRLSGAVLHRRGAELERFVLEVAAGVRRGDFFPRPGPDRQHCASCDFEAVCEVRVAQQATLKAPAGQTAFVEALPDFATALEGAPERDASAEGEA
jgi:RecB family exonuclease